MLFCLAILRGKVNSDCEGDTLKAVVTARFDVLDWEILTAPSVFGDILSEVRKGGKIFPQSN